jgi:hypothetical protein
MRTPDPDRSFRIIAVLALILVIAIVLLSAICEEVRRTRFIRQYDCHPVGAGVVGYSCAGASGR